MKKNSNKSGILKAVIATSLVWITALSATAVFANVESVTGVRAPVHVNVNGERVQFTPDTAPVNIDGRNFFPVATLADLLGVAWAWDGATSTINLGARAGVPTAFPNAVAVNDASRRTNPGQNFNQSANSGVRVYDHAYLEGRAFADVLTFVTWGMTGGGLEWSQHMLNGNYTRLTGYFGRQHGSAIHDVEVRFYADGVRVHEFEQHVGTGLTRVDLDVFGVNNLRIEVRNVGGGAAGRAHGFAAHIH